MEHLQNAAPQLSERFSRQDCCNKASQAFSIFPRDYYYKNFSIKRWFQYLYTFINILYGKNKRQEQVKEKFNKKKRICQRE